MGDSLMQFGRELKARIRFHFLHPQPYYFWFKMLIKRAVNLDSIEPPRQKLEGVEAAPVRLWVNQSSPVRIRPSCGAKKGGGGH
jgi:hypothetical protein